MPPKKTVPSKSTKTTVAASSSKTAPKKSSTTTKKGPAKVAPKKSTKDDKEPKEQPKLVKKWTKEDEAAKKIQKEIRRFLAKKTLEKKKKEKLEYEELMEKLEKEAFVKLVKMEQEKYEKERKKEEEERKRKKEEKSRMKKFLEAAFDGDNVVIENLLKEVSKLDDTLNIGHDVVGKALRNKHQIELIDCEDPHGNTPLSEASSGGNKDTVRLLLLKGADPNSRGQFERTPLYRAAFAGHCEVVEELLERGADPRVYASDGQTPAQIASKDVIVNLLENWDINRTEKLLNKVQEEKNKRLEEDRKRKEIETSKLENVVLEKQNEYKTWQKRVCQLSGELEKRIYEHDTAADSGFDKPEITISAIKDAEAELEIAKMNLEKSRSALAEAKLALREKQKENIGDETDEDLPGLKVHIKELDDVLLRDVGNRIKESGKWPLLIDISGQAATFLRYRDTNYMNSLNLSEMEPEKIRLCILGALRYGKPAVLDMMEVDMFDTVSDRFNEVEKGLMDSIMDQSILQESKYEKLIRKTDNDDYQKNRFIDSRTKNFKFFIITKNPYPPEELLEKTYAIRIHIPTD